MIYLEYIRSIPIVLWLKICNNKNLAISWKQRINTSFSIKTINKGKITIRGVLHSRRNCSLICDRGHLSVGNGVFLNQNVMITCLDEITIGDNVTIANNVVIVDHDHNFRDSNGNNYTMHSVHIGDNTWIGANSVILKGAYIGESCVVAAGTVVKEGTYPPHSIIFNKRETKVSEYINE